MKKAVIILHSSPYAPDKRAWTALRLGGAMLADNKEVCLFLVEEGAQLADANLPADDPCRLLFKELMDVGLAVEICGATLKKLGWEEAALAPGINRSSMKNLSTLLSDATEVVTL